MVYNLGFTHHWAGGGGVVNSCASISTRCGPGWRCAGGSLHAGAERNESILKPRTTPVFKELSAGISIMGERPRIGLAVIVKTINGLLPMVLLSYYLLFLLDKHFTLEEWASIWGLPLFLTVSSTLSFG